jgi:bifunctional UDP-N-acetylglucosamine pyrophosphorylase/glucosamine-1-phosphate N-acetyltransferase
LSSYSDPVPLDLTVIVLAAGGGTRMKSKTMKVLHEVGGRSMIGHVLTAALATDPARIVAVVGHHRDQVGPHIHLTAPDAVLAVQEEQLGTGHAVRVAMAATDAATSTVVVATGDTPLLTGESLRALVTEHIASQAAVSILSGVVDDPFGLGRVVRDDEGNVLAIVEEKDASDAQREIHEINSGSSPSTPPSWSTPSRGSATTTPRASTASPTSSVWPAATD